MKKVFTLLALLACFLGANAKEVVDLEIDNNFTSLGWQSESAQARVSIQDGIICFHSEEAVDPFYDVQFQLPGVPSFDRDGIYTITLKIKGTVAQNLHSSFSGGAAPGDIPVTSEWQTLTFENCVNDPNNQYWANSAALLIQCGDYVGDWQISYLKITHEERDNQRPKEWIQLLENGDAEQPWGDLANIGPLDANNNYKVCAWGKVYGQDNSDPVPAKIEVDEGNPSNHVFVVHSTETFENPWDNQFWIMAPRELKDGEPIQVTLRYKASTDITVSIQGHDFPSQYRNNFNLGYPSGMNFTTDWQEAKFEGTWQGGWSIVWNLNSSSNGAPVDFYFDDITLSELKVDHGWFVASSSTTNGIAYDYDNAIEFEEFGDGILTATVGTQGKPDTWVNELMISTVRGFDNSFKSNTIAATATNIVPFDPESEDGKGIYNFTEQSNKKIALPAAGVWQIYLFTGTKQIAFVQIEGDAVVVKDPVDIITNKEVLVIEGVERDDLADNSDGTVREEEGGTGQTWDNQFFIVANRVLQPNEETVLEFDYVATTEAGTTTGTHASPGDYRKNAIPDFTFTTEEQHLKVDYTVPAADWNNNPITDAQSISFDLAMIKGACTYTIKNVKWYLKDENNESGKTMENLVKETGTDNFYFKIGAGTSPYTPSGISSVVNDKKASNVIYNLAGQRVSKDYKGIVIKNGAKYIAK